MKKTITHYYRDQTGAIRLYYTAIIKPLPCRFCNGQKKVPKFCKPREDEK